MKIAVCSVQSDQHIGIVQDDQIINLTVLSTDEFPACMKIFIKRSGELRTRAEELIEQRSNDRAILALSEVKLLPPIRRPEKIICVGLNYIDHCKETGMEPPASPVIFLKYAKAIVGHHEAIEIQVNSNEVDY